MTTLEAPSKMTALDGGTEHGITWATCRAPIYGAVNGYAKIPAGHPWHGRNYDDIDVEIHGGLTYGGGEWIGFDTVHAGDYWPGMANERFALPRFEDDHVWTAAEVAEEAKKLARRVAAVTSDAGSIKDGR